MARHAVMARFGPAGVVGVFVGALRIELASAMDERAAG